MRGAKQHCMYMAAIAGLCFRFLGCQPSLEPAYQRVGAVRMLQVGPVVARHCRRGRERAAERDWTMMTLS